MIKIGLCGAGFMGTMHSSCYAALPGVKVAAVADIRPDAAKKIAGKSGAVVYPNARALIRNAEVDAVDICLPTYLHCEHALLAARRGVAAMCEKPLALTLAEGNRIVKAVRAAKIKFMVGQVIRFWPEYRVLKNYYDTRKLGKLVALSLSRTTARPDFGWKDWFNKPELSGGATLDMHIHDADFVRYLLGEPKGLCAVGVARKTDYDYVFVHYDYPGIAVSCEGMWTPADPFDMMFRAVFEKGTLHYSSRYQPLCLYAPGKPPTPVKVPQPNAGNVAAGGNISSLGGYFNEIQYFVDCLKRNREPAIASVEEARDSLALVFDEFKASAKKGWK